MVQKRLKATNEPLYIYHRSEHVSCLSIIGLFDVFFTIKESIYTLTNKFGPWTSKNNTIQHGFIGALHKKNTSPQGTTCYYLFFHTNHYYSIFRLLSRCLMPHIDVYFISNSFRQHKDKNTFFIQYFRLYRCKHSLTIIK